MIGWSVVLGAAFGAVLYAFGDVIPELFTNDDAVVEQAHEIWWLFALMMPLNGAVFALDGILIGAGDTRFLMWGMLAAAAVYVPVALLALDQGWGILGVWIGLAGLIAVRLLTCGLRFASERWALTGPPARVRPGGVVSARVRMASSPMSTATAASSRSRRRGRERAWPGVPAPAAAAPRGARRACPRSEPPATPPWAG